MAASTKPASRATPHTRCGVHNQPTTTTRESRATYWRSPGHGAHDSPTHRQSLEAQHYTEDEACHHPMRVPLVAVHHTRRTHDSQPAATAPRRLQPSVHKSPQAASMRQGVERTPAAQPTNTRTHLQRALGGQHGIAECRCVRVSRCRRGCQHNRRSAITAQQQERQRAEGSSPQVLGRCGCCDMDTRRHDTVVDEQASHSF